MIFKPFLSGLYGKDYDFEKDKPNIEKKKQDNYISYKYTINKAKNIENNGLCIEVKFYYNREKFNINGKISRIDGMDISLSKGKVIIAEITRNFIKTHLDPQG